MTKKINEPTDVIAAAYTRWKRNRDIITGEDAVKKAGETYLPKLGNQSIADYDKYLARVPFFPGASRTHDGLLGLVTRKAGVLEGPAALEDVFETITHSGDTVDDLTEEVFSETLKTGFTGLLVDLPNPTEEVVTVADARAQNYRPFIAIYAAEAILEVTPGVVNNRQKIVRVRLLDDADTVRELVLENGVYSVIIHRNTSGNWVADAPVIPTKDGRPLTDIPFILVTPKPRGFAPSKGPMDDVVLLNTHLYLAQADAKNSRYYSSAPILTILGAKQTDLTINPGTVLFFESHTSESPVEVKFTEFSGAGQQTLENAVATIKDEMAKLGSNILASEKASAEAAETLEIRRSSENSVLASLARTVGRKIEEALNWVAWWMGNEENAVSFEVNTDFVPRSIDPQHVAQLLAALNAGHISRETFWSELKSGEWLPESFDAEEETARLAADSAAIDRPTGPMADPMAAPMADPAQDTAQPPTE